MPLTRATQSTGMAHARNTSILSSSQRIPRSPLTLHDMSDPWLQMSIAQCSTEESSATQPTASQRTASCESFTSASRWLSWWNKLEDVPLLAGRECSMFSLRPSILVHQFSWAARKMSKTSKLSTRPRLRSSYSNYTIKQSCSLFFNHIDVHYNRLNSPRSATRLNCHF